MNSDPIGEADVDDLQALVREIVGLLGIRSVEKDQAAIEQQILDMTAYLKTHYRKVPRNELRNAYHLYVKGALLNAKGEPMPVFRLFDPPSVGEVMGAYRRQRDKLLQPFIKNQQLLVALPESKEKEPTPEEVEQQTENDFRWVYQNVQQGKAFTDLGNAFYDWLDAKGLIPFTPERKWAFYAQAAEQIRQKVVAKAASGEASSGERRRMKVLGEAIKQSLDTLQMPDEDTERQVKVLAKQIAFSTLLGDLVASETTPDEFLQK